MPGAVSKQNTQWLPIAEIAAKVNAGELKAADLVEKSLHTIAEQSEFQAIIVTLDEAARARAAEIDSRVASGESAGRLAGVPFIAKDNYLVFGADTTAASNILRGFKVPYQSTVINRLEAEGAICVAKANLDAFAHGGSTENSDFFTTKNPHDPERVPGGSSGGSAAAVILDMAPFALGTDTGGSIRQPASFTGAVGFKPTYGTTSRSGVVAMASSTDVMGPLTRSVDDAALVYDVFAGPDPLDSTTIERDPQGYSDIGALDLSGTKVGIIKEYFSDSLDSGVRKVIEDGIAKLREAGAEIVEVSLPSLPLALAVYYIVVPAEVSSNLSRYDGQRYGYSYPEAKNLEESYSMSRGRGFGQEAKRRIMIGTYVLSSGYYDAYYKKAQTVRTKLLHEFNDAFEQVDFLVGPTAPTIAFKIGENAADPLQMYMSDVLTVGPSLTGVPAIVVPAGISEGLPVGIQLIAAQRADRKLLELAKRTEEILGMIPFGLPDSINDIGLTRLIMAGVAVIILIALIFFATWLTKRRFSKPNVEYFTRRWRELQKLCSDTTTWPLAIIDADKLLDDALKKSHFRGKSMGERLVTAQRSLSDNDGVWYAHKLRNKLVHEQYDKLREKDVKNALIGFRQALKDLGALK